MLLQNNMSPFSSSTPIGLHQLLYQPARPPVFGGNTQWPSVHGGNRLSDSKPDPIREMLHIPASQPGKAPLVPDVPRLMGELVDKLNALLTILSGKPEQLQHLFRVGSIPPGTDTNAPTAGADPIRSLLQVTSEENPFALGLEDFARMRIEDESQSGII